MKILFCCEGFLIDGVTSYNLYMSAALKTAGHEVAVAGRWAGFNGFQKRHRQSGVTIIQSYSPLLKDPVLISRCTAFKPDLIITDARRSFPLALSIKRKTAAPLVTIFHDYPQLDRDGSRSIHSLIEESDLWLTSEKHIHQQLCTINGSPPSFFLQRPVTAAITCNRPPQKDPFTVLCLGRLSSWKSPGIRYMVENGYTLKQAIPSLQIVVVGGGRRIVNLWISARKANRLAGKPFIHLAGTQTDPNPWFNKASLVCAGATSATEAILSNRPVIAMSGIWLGLVTPENIEYGIKSHFGERRETIDSTMRSSSIDLHQHPGIIGKAVIDFYQNWDDDQICNHISALHEIVRKHYHTETITNQFDQIISKTIAR